MSNPKNIIKFIEDNKLGYLLGNVVREICRAAEDKSLGGTVETGQLKYLKNARDYLNIEIKRLSRSKPLKIGGMKVKIDSRVPKNQIIIGNERGELLSSIENLKI